MSSGIFVKENRAANDLVSPPPYNIEWNAFLLNSAKHENLQWDKDLSKLLNAIPEVTLPHPSWIPTHDSSIDDWNKGQQYTNYKSIQPGKYV